MIDYFAELRNDNPREGLYALWQDLLTQDPPLPLQERLDALLDAHEATLEINGRLTPVPAAPTPAELDTAAQWLAGHSAFPRYTQGDGWRLLRTHTHDIEVAYAKAKLRLSVGEEDVLHDLIVTRRILLADLNAATGADT